MVTSVLHTGAFEVVRTFAIESTNPLNRDRHITIYRYRGRLERTTGLVTIPMMTIRNDIEARLSDLAGRPWPN